MASNTGPTGMAIVLQRIAPREGVDSGDLEKLLLHDVFASINTAGDGETADEHVLLDADGEYVWMSRLEYGIHAAPAPMWLINRVDELKERAQSALSAVATISSAEFHYDVAAWRRILGI
jgi:hypothetical protein